MPLSQSLSSKGFSINTNDVILRQTCTTCVSVTRNWNRKIKIQVPKPSNLYSSNQQSFYINFSTCAVLVWVFWLSLFFGLFPFCRVFSVLKKKEKTVFFTAQLDATFFFSTVLDQHKLVSPSFYVVSPFPTLHLLTSWHAPFSPQFPASFSSSPPPPLIPSHLPSL